MTLINWEEDFEDKRPIIYEEDFNTLKNYIWDLLERQHKKSVLEVLKKIKLIEIPEGTIISGPGFRNGRQCDEYIVGFNDAVDELEKLKAEIKERDV